MDDEMLSLLYLSLYLKAHRAEYYDRLTAVRTEGNWEGWLKFFLRGVAEASSTATRTARSILQLREQGRNQILRELGSTALAQPLFDYLFEQPIITVRLVEKHLNCSYAKANALVESFGSPNLGFLEEVTGKQRNRRYRFAPYLALFDQGPSPANTAEETPPAQTTRSNAPRAD